MKQLVTDTLLLYLPAFIANGTPVVFTAIPWVRKHNAPVWPERLGAHKTWMGFLSGVVAGIICGAILHWSLPVPSAPTANIFYADFPFALFFGCILGAGALLGDALKSLLKRLLGIPSGAWLPVLDAIDYTAGALFVALPLYVPTWQGALLLLALGWIASAFCNVVSYTLGIKKVWY